jgi:hypothetical protein
MQRIDGRLVFSPSDLNHFLECEHLITLDLARDPSTPRAPRDAQADLLAEKGAEHERVWLERFKAEGHQAVSIEAAGGERDWLKDAERTREATRSSGSSGSSANEVGNTRPAGKPASTAFLTSATFAERNRLALTAFM